MAEGRDINQLVEDGAAIDEALLRAARPARLEYVRAGLSMPVRRGGRVVWIAPEQLQADDGDSDR